MLDALSLPQPGCMLWQRHLHRMLPAGEILSAVQWWHMHLPVTSKSVQQPRQGGPPCLWLYVMVMMCWLCPMLALPTHAPRVRLASAQCSVLQPRSRSRGEHKGCGLSAGAGPQQEAARCIVPVLQGQPGSGFPRPQDRGGAFPCTAGRAARAPGPRICTPGTHAGMGC